MLSFKLGNKAIKSFSRESYFNKINTNILSGHDCFGSGSVSLKNFKILIEKVSVIEWKKNIFYGKEGYSFRFNRSYASIPVLKGRKRGALFITASFVFKVVILYVVGVIICVGWYYFRNKEVTNGATLAEPQVNLLGTIIPTRCLSRIWGSLASCTIPISLRSILLGSYCSLFGCIREEIPKPLEEYKNFNDFFTRRISMEHRPISSDCLTSPVDGNVLQFGVVGDGWAEQIKGVKYNISNFLGYDIVESIEKRNLFYAVIYLAPGDYHGVHSPCDFSINLVRHYPGHLFSVSPFSSKFLDNLLVVNERVVMSGLWKNGFFSLTPVGAYNVGSISLEFDSNFSTNKKSQKATSPSVDTVYSSLNVTKGDHLSFFNMGSTVVMIFEAPDIFTWNIKPGDKIKVGQGIGRM